MVSSTRQSSRLADKTDNMLDKPQEQTSPKGTKRKADTTSPKKGRGSKDIEPEKKQKTLEETIGDGDAPNDEKMIEVAKAVEGKDKQAEDKGNDAGEHGQQAGAIHDKQVKHEDGKNVERVKSEESSAIGKVGAVQESLEREQKMPTNIIEKGIIYFFTRGRVGIEHPEGPEDLQRTYFVLRPLPNGAKLGDGPIEDSSNNRLFALPKKVFPKSHSDRYMAFVENGKTTIQHLKDTFFGGATHETKTQGTRVDPATAPIGEGVYAITETGRSSHLVYMLTIPSELGEVQEQMGLRSKGSFIMSVKNPERKGPANARLPQGPQLPKEIVEEFRGLAWVPVKSKYLEYDNVQILLIGEGTRDNLAHALEPKSKDEKDGKEHPQEELEKLEHEDELRVQHLHGDDTVFDDLKLSKDEYPKVQTTW